MEFHLKHNDMSSNLKEIIKKISYQIGFDKVGFTKPVELNSEVKNLVNWLSMKYHASMYYLEKNTDKRKDIRLIMPEVKSVIVFAHSYFTINSYINNNFKVSRYAWGNDYHKVLFKKIKQIAETIKGYFIDLKYKIYIDTGPLSEKQWAVLSGIGWQGKNSLVLSKELGSYFFLGVLLTNIDFEPDQVSENHCGTCTRCIDACPTKAIVEPKVIDSRKCISFWTIEKRIDEDIPNEIDFNGWIFGCDICQEVCPWNKKAK
ncbi:MAG: tRNA epoxyqueuosine(34) reductase QueG, partial [Candidatus Kapaibacteriota bacterium]